MHLFWHRTAVAALRRRSRIDTYTSSCTAARCSGVPRVVGLSCLAIALYFLRCHHHFIFNVPPWYRRVELNHEPAPYQDAALPLSYDGIIPFFIIHYITNTPPASTTVRVRGFEPLAPWSQTRCSDQTELHPEFCLLTFSQTDYCPLIDGRCGMRPIPPFIIIGP